MSQTTAASGYYSLTRPPRDTTTLYRYASRAAAAQQQQQRAATATSHADGAFSSASTNAPLYSSSSASDTWTGFLRSQWTESVKSASAAAAAAAPTADAAAHPPSGSGGDVLSALQSVVARQNRVVAQLQEKLVAQRQREEKEWEKKVAQLTSASTSREASKEERRGGGSGGAGAAPSAAVENTQVCVLLSNVLEHARLTWANAVTEHFNRAEARKPSFTKASSSGGGSGSSSSSKANSPKKPIPAPAAKAATADITAESTMDEERVGLPTIELLFRCLVDGMNSTETQRSIVASGLLPPSAWDSGVLGVDQLGVLTVFQRHVQALRTFPGLVPPLEALRDYFAELHPSNLSVSVPCGPLDGSLEVMESQLDTFLRMGEEAEQIAGMLRESLHPSMRRLVYARALQVPLAVTDGKPLFSALTGGFMTNHHGSGIAGHLTCASRHARDKLKRRFQHHYSSPKQEGRARLLQRLALDDMFTAVGDSDKYFVYADDVEVAATALVVDRSVPDMKLKHTLAQLGRPEAALEAYVTFLRFPEKHLVTQKAPMCGFFPVEGVTFLLAPLCNVTGDTVEQYELMSAMTAQLWARLQGPTPELLQCCLIFESLVQRLALPAVLHATRNLQYPPLVLAMRWMLTGFADVLDSFEVLSFWDLVLSYHVRELHRRSPLSSPVGLASGQPADRTTPCALWLLPLYAAAIFVLRAPMVEACRTAEEVDVVFATGHQLRTRSLLQGLLFG